MDLSIINLLFSAVFVLIGSLAFHISALVSGDDIYRDLPTQESALLSIVAGIVIFLLSPISFIIFSSSNACYVGTLVQILDFEILLAFFGCAFGLGLIFGSLSIVKARVAILDWFRDESGMKFWISSYGIAWDDFLGCVKGKGEVFVQTDGKMFTGSLLAFSAKHEQREIVLGKCKTTKTDGSEVDLQDITKDEKNVDVLIPGSEIKRIIVPGRSFKKHYESMGHISQAFYCQISAIGLFFLSYSAHLTGNYIEKVQNLTSASLEFFYDWLSLSFLALTVIVLCISVWVAEKDFDNWRSFLMLSPFIPFVASFFSLLSILLISDYISISQAVILIFALLVTYLIYIKISDWLEELKESIKKWKSFFMLPRDITFVGLSVILLLLLILIFIGQISQVLEFGHSFFPSLSGLCVWFIAQISPLFIFIFAFSLLCILFGNQLKKPIKNHFDYVIKSVSEDYTTLLQEVCGYVFKNVSKDDEKSLKKVRDLLKNVSEDDKKSLKKVFDDAIKNVSRDDKKLSKDDKKKSLKKVFDDAIKNVSKDDKKLLKEVIQKFYLRLSCNDKEKTRIEDVGEDIRKEYGNSNKRSKIDKMIEGIDELKEKMEYLKEEDFNIILEFRKYLKKN